MATYSNNTKDEAIYYGSEFKLNVHMDPIGDNTLGSCDFTCTFSTGNDNVVLAKSYMLPVSGSSNDYTAPLNSIALGKGTLTVTFSIDIPDSDFSGDNHRTEVVVIPTKLKIM